MTKIIIKQEESYDWEFQNEAALEAYLEDIEQELSEEQFNKIKDKIDKQRE
jgi:hypothetical protein